MELYIMRHGQTESNRQHLLQGQMNTKLSEDGIQQAQEARQHFQEQGIVFDRVICSPLDRARKTAELASGFAPEDLIVDERIKEIGFGPLEGHKVEALDEDTLKFFKDPEHYVSPEGAEPYEQLIARTWDFLQNMLQQKPEGRTLVVSHGAAIHAMYLKLLDLPMIDFWTTTMGNCGYFIVTEEAGLLKVTGTHFNEQYRTLPKFAENK